ALAPPSLHSFPTRRSSDLERLFFLCIFSKNLDEFYEVRVANLTRQLAFAREQAGADGMHPQQVLNAIHTLCSTTVERQNSILNRSEEHTSELQSRENLVCR